MSKNFNHHIIMGVCFVAIIASLAVINRYSITSSGAVTEATSRTDTAESNPSISSTNVDSKSNADKLPETEALENSNDQLEADIVAGELKKKLNAWNDYDQHMKNRVVVDGISRAANCSINNEDRVPCTFTPRKIEGRFAGFRLDTNNDIEYEFSQVRDGIMDVDSSDEPTPLGRFIRDENDAACWSQANRKICVW